jgi:hypothetical protein
MDCMGLLLVGVRLNEENEKESNHKNNTEHTFVEKK